MNKTPLKSHLPPFTRTSLTSDWKKISKALDYIFEDKCEKIRLGDLTPIIYRQCSYNRSNDIIRKIQDKFENYFQNFLTTSLSSFDQESPDVDELAKEYIIKAGDIMPRFDTVITGISAIFCHIQMFRGYYDFNEKFKTEFINILEKCNCYDYIFFSISKLFDLFLNQYQVNSFLQEPLFQSVQSTKNLIYCASPDNMQVLQNMLLQKSEVYFTNFINYSYQQLIPPLNLNENSDEGNESNDNSIFIGESHKIADEKEAFDPIPHIVEYCDESMRLVELEYQMTIALFDEHLASDLKKEALYKLSDPDTETMTFCLSQTHLFLKKRQIENFQKLFNLAKKNADSVQILSQKICEQIPNEPHTIDKLPEVIDFYTNIDKNLFSNKEYFRFSDNIHKSLSRLVNSDLEGLMKGLLKTINTAALTDYDISSILPIISFLQKRNEFEHMNLCQVAQRLIRNGIKQIDNETEILNQLGTVKPPLQLESLRILIKESDRSFQDNQYGPVLLLNATSWPYKPPYPSPVALNIFATKISEKYTKNNPSRELQFPINFWIVNVKDEISGTIYNGTGVQAEILLYFNNHKVITVTALEPKINQSFLGAALKSMSNKASPVLTVNDGAYSLNENWKPDKIVKLKPPVYKNETQVSKNAEKAKGDMIKACAVAKMKAARILKFSELDEYIKNELASKVHVTTDDVKKYVDILIELNYLEEMGSGRLAYIS